MAAKSQIRVSGMARPSIRAALSGKNARTVRAQRLKCGHRPIAARSFSRNPTRNEVGRVLIV